MKMLIVDDEELTRKGLLSSLNWEKLGIDEVLVADDGINVSMTGISSLL